MKLSKIKPWHWILIGGFLLFLFVEYNPFLTLIILAIIAGAAYIYFKNS